MSFFLSHPWLLPPPLLLFNKMTLSTSSSAYSLPGYNLRANSAAAQNAPPLGSGNLPNPIEKRVKLAHSHPERSIISKVRLERVVACVLEY